MRVADYVCKRLAEAGVSHVFLVTGGGAMHLNDALAQSSLSFVCTHHEQGAVVAAEGYARAGERLAAAMVTTGPGATNAITGVIGAYFDSVPMIVVSGQVKRETCMSSYPDLEVRQLGDQEVDIIRMVSGVTKYATQLRDPALVGIELDRCIEQALTGRPGPVWLDIPVDVQGTKIDESTLLRAEKSAPRRADLGDAAARVAALLASAKRPLVVAGQGVRLAHAVPALHRLLDSQKLPAASTLLGFDLVPSDHPSHVGRIGSIGERAGNLALQNADLVLFLGTRNNIRQASYAYQRFARSAIKVVVDIDPGELEKPTVRPDVPVLADAGEFLDALLATLETPTAEVLSQRHSWLDWCQERRRRFPTVLPEYAGRPRDVHPYVFMQELSRAQPADSITVTANATACIVYFQTAEPKAGQRVIWNSGSASMGYGLPAALGAHAATGRPVVCLEGEGSLMMNLQELQTLATQGYPIKLFVLENGGYVSILQTQTNHFAGRLIGTGPTSGVGFPDLSTLARAFGLPFAAIECEADLLQLPEFLARPGPLLCRVSLPHDYAFAPKLASHRLPNGTMVSRPLEDMAPFLSREELAENMLVPLLPDE